VAAIVEASVWLWRVLRGALVVQEELIEPSHSLHGFVWQQLRRGSDLSATATKRRQAKNSQCSLQKPSRRAKPEAEVLHREYRRTPSASRHVSHDEPRRMFAHSPEL
jgi:hypothetical protein